MDEFNLIDLWRNEHPTLRAYTRHQRNPPVLSRLDYILVSSNFADNIKNSEIVCGIKSDHSIVSCKVLTKDCPKGKGYWKLNCHYLRHDADFVSFIKSKISEFKGVLHPWTLFLKTLCIFSKNKATSEKVSNGSGQKCSKELKNHSFT